MNGGMSAFCTKRTSLVALHMSAFGGKAHDGLHCKRLLLTQSGHTKMLAETGELPSRMRHAPCLEVSWQSPRNEGDHHDDGALTIKGELMATPAGGGE